MSEESTPVIRADLTFVGDVGPLFDALAKAQGEFPAIEKTNTAEVKKEGRLLYTNEYAPLDVIIDAVRPALAKYGLSVSHFPTGADMITVLAHGAARVESRCSMPGWETSQQLGGVITYLRRYTLLAALGVFPGGEDDDANGASGQQAAITQKPRATPPTAKPAQAPAVLPETKAEVIRLSKAAGHANAKELDEFSRKAGAGPLDGQTEVNALLLLDALRKLQVRQ